MGYTLAKVASNFALLLLEVCLGPAVGPTQFLVEKKGDCDQMRALHMEMESNGRLSPLALTSSTPLVRSNVTASDMPCFRALPYTCLSPCLR
jgi:hypothetical protein